MTTKAPCQKGSIIVYILIAIFLTGLLVSMMSQGTKKSASSGQVNELMLYLQADIQTVQSNITECVVSYQNNNFCPPSDAGGCVNQFATQDAGNPNVPFPMGNGGALTAITCPRAPAAQQTIFTGNTIQSLKLFQDTANYTVTYFTNNTEGIYFRITRNVSDPVWTEALVRMDTKYSACSVAYVAPGGMDPTGFSCTNGCLYYWIKRLPTSSASWKAGCP